MTKDIRLNAFVGNSPVHLSPGLWAHPRNRALEYKDLNYWVELAKVLERGKFDALFVADGIGVYDVFHGSADSSIRSGAQVPKHDPLMAVSAMAHVTKHLGFGITASTSHEIPAVLARRFSSLDHLTKGRIGWNVVTGFTDSSAKALGHDSVLPHDTRYDRADEFLEATYKLWEGSWQEGAVIRDRASGVFADPTKVRRVRHKGEYFQLDTIHLTEPSPQRTPFLFQAGLSKRGRDFAAQHAEAVLLSGPSKATIGPAVRDMRERAVRFGRDPHDIIFFSLATVIVGRTREEANAKLDEYRSYVDPEGALALFSGWTGIDFSQFELGAPLLAETKDNAVHSMIDSFTSADPTRVWTLQEVVEHNGIGGRGPLLVGSPTDIADALQSWGEETGVDGFNLSYAVMPETYIDFVDLVVPELQRRGVYKKDYAPGTLRTKLHGQDALKVSHPGAAFRSFGEIDPAA
ncbi:FMN-dependent oxidoreductase (nitrilotriacetate monooxygenase family) [Bradyrhizobium sp. AZCC 2262]|uniref:LLM class flavin-dependent oxidoreductase n=1 Tax=Bradyrhizobium sp. AZCC 2262 TaxID=3117022 RepID=UPI002FEED3B3